MKSEVLIFDHRPFMGGGQVVLSRLALRLSAAGTPVTVVAPRDLHGRLGFAGNHIPKLVDLSGPASVPPLVGDERTEHTFAIANTYPVLVGVLRTARVLRQRGYHVTTVGILHSYPASRRRRHVVRNLLRRVDVVIAVEPGLSVLSSRLMSTAILGPNVASSRPLRSGPTGAIKAFARADPSKGLHQLPAAYSALSERLPGIRCLVAVSPGLENKTKYERTLLARLGPWLVEGARTSAWIEPGDIYLSSSTYGEAVCLSAQEAMANGAFVVAPRLGALPYFGISGGGVRIYGTKDVGQMVRAVEAVWALPRAAFIRGCDGNAQEARLRADAWYDDVVNRLHEIEYGYGL